MGLLWTASFYRLQCVYAKVHALVDVTTMDTQVSFSTRLENETQFQVHYIIIKPYKSISLTLNQVELNILVRYITICYFLIFYINLPLFIFSAHA